MKNLRKHEKSRLMYTTATVLCLSIVAPLLLTYFLAPRLIPLVSQNVFMAINETCFWMMGIGVVIVVLFWERLPLRSIGFRHVTMKESLLSLSLGVLLFILIPALGILLERVFGIMTSTMVIVAALAKYPIWLRAILAARAGFVEEILYRAYPIERLNRLTGRLWPGALFSIVLFTAIHIPSSGLEQTLGVVFPISAILTGLYIWKRNLTLNITVHFLIDFLLLVLLPLFPALS